MYKQTWTSGKKIIHDAYCVCKQSWGKKLFMIHNCVCNYWQKKRKNNS